MKGWAVVLVNKNVWKNEDTKNVINIRILFIVHFLSNYEKINYIKRLSFIFGWLIYIKIDYDFEFDQISFIILLNW